jgi:hypothetical protein
MIVKDAFAFAFGSLPTADSYWRYDRVLRLWMLPSSIIFWSHLTWLAPVGNLLVGCGVGALLSKASDLTKGRSWLVRHAFWLIPTLLVVKDVLVLELMFALRIENKYWFYFILPIFMLPAGLIFWGPFYWLAPIGNLLFGLWDGTDGSEAGLSQSELPEGQ